MSIRDVVKEIIRFGRREYKEKKPLMLRVLRIKSKSVLTRGILPALNMKQIKGTFYLIVADYGDFLRLYSFGKNGQMLGGENVEKNEKVLKEIDKSTKKLYLLPKEKPKLTLSDITTYYKEEFEKVLLKCNQLFGFNLKLPYVIVASDKIPLRPNRSYGTARILDKNKKKLVISIKFYKKDEIVAIASREIMFLYLRDLIVMFQDIQGEGVYWHDLAILFANYYLRNEKNSLFLAMLEKGTKSFLSFQDGQTFYFSDKVVSIFKENSRIISKKQRNELFHYVFTCLKLFKRYEIKLRYLEFSNLFYDLCEFFLQSNNRDFHQTSSQNFYRFHYSHFTKSLQNGNKSKKLIFLVQTFGILGHKNYFEEDIYQLIREMKDITQDPILQKEIGNYQELINEALLEYITHDVLVINSEIEIEKQSIKLKLNIANPSSYVFQDFRYNISWKPRKRLLLLLKEEIKKARDLHDFLSSSYSWAVQSEGSVKIICKIEFSHPFILEDHLTKELILEKILLK